LLSRSNLPMKFGCYVTLHATLLPTPLVNNISYYETLHGKLFYVSTLHVLGCLYYANTLTSNRKIMDNHVSLGIFIGFKAHTKGYMFLNLRNHKIDISRYVVFHENRFHYHLDCDVDMNRNNISLSVSIINVQNNNGNDVLNSDNIYCDANIESNVNLQRPTRIRGIPTYLEDF